MEIAFFDVDHTLTRRSSGARFITCAIREGIVPARFLFSIPYHTFTYRMGFFRMGKYANGLPLVVGMPKATLEDLAQKSFDARLRDDLYPEAVVLVRDFVRKGVRVVLATSSFDFIVRPLADFLKVDDVIASSLEYKEGVCTGNFSRPPLFRQEKRIGVLEYIGKTGAKPEDCAFYSDSIFDLPLLESVGSPVMVNPDFRLRRIARERNWPVIRFA